MSIIDIQNLSKVYEGGFQALSNVNLQVQKGEILALLGPNGAGKTTLISTICGIANPTKGAIKVDGYDIIKDFRKTRSMIGLVPQELTTDAFESVWDTVSFSRGLFGKPKSPSTVERILKDLSLWEKKDNRMMTLSGGMKRRVMIAKALSHEPEILFLDEPSAGVDVELRKDMWRIVEELRQNGVTIILTTHYIEEAEAIADRVAVINGGKIVIVDEKKSLMRKLGKKTLSVQLAKKLTKIPKSLKQYDLDLTNEGTQLIYVYDTNASRSGIASLLTNLNKAGLQVKDMDTKQSSLEDIFVDLVNREASPKFEGAA